MKFIKLSARLVVIALSAGLFSACGGGADADAPLETPSSTATTAAAPAATASTYAGTYTGTIGRVSNASTYDGPASITLTRDVTGNYTLSGTWNVTRTNSSGPQSITNETLSGTVNSAGVLTATGNINLRALTGNVDASTGRITGSFTYAGIASEFTGEFVLAK